MAPKAVAPSFAARSFSCPHCGALANQSWFVVRADASHSDGPFLFNDEIFGDLKRRTSFKNEEDRIIHESWCTYADKARTGTAFLWKMKQSRYDDYEVANIHISRCFSCREIAIWKYNTILHPTVRFEVEPNADLPEDIRRDFDEARTILDLSPRGAAALLRLCIQKLCKHLGKSGRSIDADIASLVKEGLDVRVQRALDIVRVIGNESVHPGTIDMRDNREIAAKLFELVNRIAYDRITHPKEIDGLFADLPADKLLAIAKRDAPQGNAV